MNCLRLLLLLACIIPSKSFAQNYKEGYAVTQKGDTLKGYINHNGLEINPRVVGFKAMGIDKPQTFPIAEIRSFGFTGLEQYERHIVKISLDGINVAQLGSGRDTSFKVDTVFLEVLQKGNNITLYSYSDPLKTRYYISDATTTVPAELLYKLYYPNSGGSYNRETVSEYSFRNQLSAFALKHNMLIPDVKRSIAGAEYNQASIADVAGKINNLTQSEIRKTPNKRIGLIGLIVLGTFGLLAILNAAF